MEELKGVLAVYINRWYTTRVVTKMGTWVIYPDEKKPTLYRLRNNIHDYVNANWKVVDYHPDWGTKYIPR